MINVVTKECIEYGCNVQASCNFSEYSVRLYCSKHKKKDMIDLKHKNKKNKLKFVNLE